MSRVTIEFETTNNTKLNDIIRLALGLIGIASPEVSVKYFVDEVEHGATDPEEISPQA